MPKDTDSRNELPPSAPVTSPPTPAERPRNASTPAAKKSLRVLIRQGRGRSGSSLGCQMVAERAIRAGRSVLVADGDINNPTLSRIYLPDGPSGVAVPTSPDIEAGKDWLATSLAKAVQRQASLIVDMGGGDRVVESLAEEANLSAFLDGFDLKPTFMYFMGPDQEDFDHVHRLWSTGAFKGDSILVQNEGLVTRGARRNDPFGWLLEDERYDAMMDGGVVTVQMPRLGCMDHIKNAGMTVFEAVDDKPPKPDSRLNPLYQFMAEQWAKEFESRLENEGVTGWLP